MAKPNLILGSVTNYGIDDLRPFMLSLHRIGFEGEVHLLVGNNPPGVLDFLSGFKVKTIKASERSHWLHNKYLWGLLKLIKLHKTDAVFKKKYDVHMSRFVVFNQFLRVHADRFENVLLTDVRDVLFQSDPFEAIGNGILAFEEDKQIGDDPEYNAKWMKACYSEAIIDELAKKKVLCVGTVFGKAQIMKLFLQRYCQELKGLKNVVFGADTSVFNFLAYKEKELPFKIVPNKGRVYTMGFADESEFVFNESDQVVGAEGRVIPVLHQYDRFEEATKRLVRALK